MLFNFNKVEIEGRLTEDPAVVLYNNGEDSLTNLTVAHNHRYISGKNADNTDKWEEKVSFVPVTAFNGTGKRAAEKLRKGDQVLVEARLEEDRWEKDGEKRSRLKLVANQIHYISSPKPKAEVAATK